MKKESALLFAGLLAGLSVLNGQDRLYSAERSISHAIGEIPTGASYVEKAGAFGINRQKEREYSIERIGDELVSVIVRAEEGKRRRVDPRTPAQLGDVASFDFGKIINDVNPFNPALGTGRIVENGRHEIDGLPVQGFEFSLTTYDRDGSSWATTGELFVDIETGTLRRIRVERQEFPEGIYGQLWELDFDGSGPAECRLISRYYELVGKYAIFKYRFRTPKCFPTEIYSTDAQSLRSRRRIRRPLAQR